MQRARSFFKIGCALSVFWISACSNLPKKEAIEPVASVPVSAPVAAPTPDPVPAPAAKIPPKTQYLNSEIQRWIDYYTGKGRETFQNFLNTGIYYKDLIEKKLAEKGLPADLFYLALVESGFQPQAQSRVGAQGIWQFMPGTAQRYGLRVDAFVDERKDPVRSTDAAAKYLKDLYTVFQSWPLAVGAYNAGEQRIVSAIIKGKARSIWTLRNRGALPAETSEYVPKFLAAVSIGRNLKKYGFETNSFIRSYSVKELKVPSAIHLRSVATVSGVPLSVLQAYNPHIERFVTPAGQGLYSLWIPSSEPVTLSQDKILSQLWPFRLSISPKRQKVVTSKVQFHTVQEGETLYSISKKYQIPLDALMRINQLSTNNIQKGERLRVAVADMRRSL